MEKDWPLSVYRHSVARGWEKQIPIQPSPHAESHQPNATGIPRAGCFVVKRFRLKISLTTKITPGTATRKSNSKNAPSSQETSLDSRASKIAEAEAPMEIIRRNDALLFTSKHKRILLKFLSARACIEFSDELVRLNRDLQVRSCMMASVLPPVPAGSVTPGASQMRLTEMVQPTTQVTPTSVQSAMYSDPLSLQLQKNDMTSYIARLLHDDDFVGLSQKLEQLMEGSPDLAQMLQALGGR